MKIGMYNVSMGNYEEGIESLNETIRRIGTNSRDSIALGVCYSVIGNAYLELNQNSRARENLTIARNILEKVGYPDPEMYAFLADLEIREKRINTARTLITKALETAEQASDLSQVLTVKGLEKKLAVEEGKLLLAISIQDEILNLTDSIRAQETLNKVYELETQFESARKDHAILVANLEIERKERFQSFLITLIVIVIVFSVTAIFLIIQRFKLRRALLSQEIDTLRVQINSIFGEEKQGLEHSIEHLNTGLYKPLSDREMEILKHAIGDQTNREIADKTFVSINTVKYHLKNIYDKLGVSNRKEALQVILQKG